MGWGRGLLIGDRAFIVLKLETDIFIDYSGFYSRPEFLTRPHHKECFSDYCMNLFWTREEEGGGGGGVVSQYFGCRVAAEVLMP